MVFKIKQVPLMELLKGENPKVNVRLNKKGKVDGRSMRKIGKDQLKNMVERSLKTRKQNKIKRMREKLGELEEKNQTAVNPAVKPALKPAVKPAVKTAVNPAVNPMVESSSSSSMNSSKNYFDSIF